MGKRSEKAAGGQFFNFSNLIFALLGAALGSLGTYIAYQQLDIAKQQHEIEVANLKKTELAERTTEKKYFVPASSEEIESMLDNSIVADCWTSSLTSSRQDAYRCATDNLIHDPCYTQDSYQNSNFDQEDIITCPSNNPDNRDGLEIYNAHIQERNKYSLEKKATHYWLIKLETGLYCRQYTGATGSLAGLGVSRGCTDGKEFKGIVLENIETNAEGQSTALYYDETKKSIEKLFVTEVWE